MLLLLLYVGICYITMCAFITSTINYKHITEEEAAESIFLLLTAPLSLPVLFIIAIINNRKNN